MPERGKTTADVCDDFSPGKIRAVVWLGPHTLAHRAQDAIVGAYWQLGGVNLVAMLARYLPWAGTCAQDRARER